ncbi:conserved hypothetical protein [Photorhabdus asymbiotica]|uniref:Uncharacterized protein n=2 Tax=Photorhabdus asymbiotica TaxID=291112 RepID=B6VMR9_PHOAA|nr:hypothetical protein [Photorhabdus asymbiotica]RKS57658.1 hypothetical protein BDD30_2467 [Photorhabdus asymbiotica]CAQ83030.1 conserved hypothetical protein [Photorhabdus asymbiotica]CAR67449.1 Hypothetical Protein PA-RVA14-1073 [Photorhabdus asymbiotica subsp. asymbiotica ATCC 43949]
MTGVSECSQQRGNLKDDGYRVIRDGDRFIYEKTLKRDVGITPEGEMLNKVRVVTESNGDLVTAFPQSVFKDLKPTDVIF